MHASARHRHTFGLLAFCAALSAASAAAAQMATTAGALRKMDIDSGAPLRVSVSPLSKLATFVGSEPGHPIPIAAARSASAEARAASFLSASGAAFGIAAADQAVVRKVSGPDEVGAEHVRLQQVYKGVPVRGGELVVHLRGSGVTAVSAKTVAGIEAVNVVPSVSTAQALSAARQMLAKDLHLTTAALSEPRLEILNEGHLKGSLTISKLSWFIEATAFGVREFIWVDAHAGSVLLHFSQIAESRNRQVYDAGGTSTIPGTLVRSEGGPATGDSDTDSAYTYAGDTYDYYSAEHSRDSYNNAGASLISTVHYCEGSCPYANAFWDGTQMVYGEGFCAADDVDAHELTHAVTEYSANLVYCLQSGALNESFSDIFGETVDLTNSGGTDTPVVRWLMGEDIPGIGAIRNMSSPGDFGDPARVSDPNFRCYSTCDPFNDQGGVHSNSGVPNHAYALMVDGGTYNSFTISGIGLTKSGKIQYRALTQYLTSASSFLDNYNALQQSCSDLVGTAGITVADCTEVKNALDAVELGGDVCPVCGDGIPNSGEACDDGNSTNGDGCDNNCTITACGNGITTGGEQCDDGNATPGDGCEASCTLTPGCQFLMSTDVPVTIADLSTATSTLHASTVGGNLTSLRVVGLRGTHTYMSDVRFSLISPASTNVVIIDQVCGGDNDFDLSLADDAGNPIACPATDGGVHTPSNPLAAFNGGAASGTWTLSIADIVGSDQGVLQAWGLLVCTTCGDGNLDSGEQCDDGNVFPGDGCGTSCQVESCAVINKASLKLTKLASVPGDDGLTFKGETTLPFPFTPALNPPGNGVRLRIVDINLGVVTDVTVPAGAFDSVSKQGWKTNGTGTKWTFSSRDGVQGITKLQITDKSSRTTGLLKLSVKGKDATYTDAGANLPLKATLVLGDGQCGQATFPGPLQICSFDGKSVKCK